MISIWQIRYSDRIALLNQGSLAAIGTPSEVVTPENLRQVFGVEAVTLSTPVGLQICLLSPAIAHSRASPKPLSLQE
jgi:iron complex transport system ATP-binding protein